MRIIIVAGSKYHNFNTYNYVDGDLFIGIEDGAYEIIKRGYELSLSIGDFDTTTHLDEILKSSIEIKKYPKEKDEIDLELALKYIDNHYPDCEIFIYNATLGRLDHELVTIKLLIKYQNLNIHLMNEFEEVIYLTSNYCIEESDKRFSLIPFMDVELEVIGARYELPRTILKVCDCYTSSNRTLSSKTYINIYSDGIILVKEV